MPTIVAAGWERTAYGGVASDMADEDQKASRVAAWEWLRAGAALSVVMLHASAPYLWHPMPGLTWSVFDRPSHIVDVVGWGIELFIMPLFLVMAGYFALPLWQRLGSGGFLRHRARRLLGPLAFAIAVILPMDLYVFLLGWVVEGQIEPRKMRSLKFEAGIDTDLWGLSHLWFLQYLFLYCLVLAAVAVALRRTGIVRTGRHISQPKQAALAAVGWAAVATLTLALHPEIVFGFQHSFLPVAPKWIYSGAFFAAGIWLAAHDDGLRRTMRDGWKWLAVGIVSAVAALHLGLRHLRLEAGDAEQSPQWLLAIATVTAAWGITAGLIGVAARHLRATGPSVRYLASASFWTYLIHHPIVALLHIDVKVLIPGLLTPLKPLLVAAIAMACCLLSFEGLVRRTWLGRLLGVRQDVVQRQQPKEADEKITPAAASEARREAA